MPVPTLVDSHCHLDCLDLSACGGNLNTVIATAAAQGVTTFLCVAITLEAWPEMMAIVRRYPQVWASVGVHPNEREGQEPSFEELITLAEDPKVVAIGETGLDYYRHSGDMTWQQARFRTHIAAARHTRKPLIIHCREAKKDIIDVLRAEQADEVGGVMHCFAEDWETAQAAVELGFYISFSGILTFKNAASLREVAQQIPLERLLVETDSPYLAPTPHRGKPNQPAYTRLVAEQLALVKGLSIEEIAHATTANFHRLFSGVGRA